jgi:hypothetical protein
MLIFFLFIFFGQKLQYGIYLSLDLYVRSSYRRSLNPSKENIEHFRTIHLFTFFVGPFSPRIRIQPTKIIVDPSPQYLMRPQSRALSEFCLLCFQPDKSDFLLRHHRYCVGGDPQAWPSGTAFIFKGCAQVF